MTKGQKKRESVAFLWNNGHPRKQHNNKEGLYAVDHTHFGLYAALASKNTKNPISNKSSKKNIEKISAKTAAQCRLYLLSTLLQPSL